MSFSEGEQVIASGECEFTRDTLLRGRVTLLQPRRGFRSSLDPVLLAGFLEAPYGRFLDIGCGTGALAFLLLARDPAAVGVGIEIQPRLAGLCRRAVVENRLEDRLRVELGDVRRAALAPGFDLVATNPPFTAKGQGALPPNRERAIAHHEVELGLGEWLDRAAALVRPAGRIAAVFPAKRKDELIAGLAARGFGRVRARLVFPRADEPASRVLVEARQGDAASYERPLYLHAENGYSEEVRAFLGETGEGPR